MKEQGTFKQYLNQKKREALAPAKPGGSEHAYGAHLLALRCKRPPHVFSFSSPLTAVSKAALTNGTAKHDKLAEMGGAIEAPVSNEGGEGGRGFVTWQSLSQSMIPLDNPFPPYTRLDTVMPPNKILYCSNMPAATTKEMLEALFGEFEGLQEVRGILLQGPVRCKPPCPTHH